MYVDLYIRFIACTYVSVNIERLYNSTETSVVVFPDLSGKEPYRQIGMSMVITSGILGGVMVGTLALNARDMGLIPTLATTIPIFITPTTLVMFSSWPPF